MTTILEERERLLNKVAQKIDDSMFLLDRLQFEKLNDRILGVIDQVGENLNNAYTLLNDIIDENFIDDSEELKQQQLELNFDTDTMPEDIELEDE